jgi:ABC-type multidrug transport system fused ATPase/permease subunit
VRRLLRLLWKHRLSCLKAFVFQTLVLSFTLSSLNLIGLAIDFFRSQLDPLASPPHWPLGLIPPEAWPPFLVICSIGLALILFSTIRALLQYHYTMTVAHLSGMEIVPTLRSEVYQKLQKLSFRFFDANPSSSIINRVTSDVQLLRAFIDEVLINGTVLFLTLSVYAVYMLRLHTGLALACLATTPVIIALAISFSLRIKKQYLHNRALFDHLTSNLSESMEGIQTIKGFAREQEMESRFVLANDEVMHQQREIFHRTSRFVAFMDFMTYLNFTILLAYGGWLVLQGQLALGTGLVVFSGLLQQFSHQLGLIATITNTIQLSLVGARRVFEILEAPIEISSKPGAQTLSPMHGHIRFENVSLEHVKDMPVLRDLDFAIKPGQHVAIMGATGSGKSALMSLIPRFYDPDRGRVLLDGIDLRQLDLTSLRQKMGFVFQESFLFNTTIAENIAFGHPEADFSAIQQAAITANAHTFIQQLPQGYHTMIAEHGANLSGGQRQRIAIARALLVNPRVLLLDDPSASLDAKTDEEVSQAMLAAMAGRTTLVVAHRLATLRRADFILVLDHGRIVQKGTHAELIRQGGLYHKIARLQLIDPDNWMAEEIKQERP